MSSDLQRDPDSEDDPQTVDTDTLRARVEVLEEENRRLREEYTRARQSQYRQTGTALAGVGALAALAGVLYPGAQTVLFALGGTGVFLGVLIFYLTPEEFLPASVGEQIYETLADNESAVVTELGLSEKRVYAPTGDGVRLYVPQHDAESTLPTEALTETFVVTETQRGLALEPTGTGLVEELQQTLADGLATDPTQLATQVTDGLVEQFELLESAETDVDPEADADAGRLTVRVSGSAYGSVERFDHPVVSLLAVSVAHALAVPVDVEVTVPDDDSGAYLVTCSWEQSDET